MSAKVKSFAEKSVEERGREELMFYQRFFRDGLVQGHSPSIMGEWKRAIYVLRTVLGVSWNSTTDPYLGFEPIRKWNRRAKRGKT